MPNIITISREFGSGGREVGTRLADILGYAYYDREILTAIAKQTELDGQYIEKVLEGMSFPAVPLHFGRSMSCYSPIMQNTIDILVTQQKIVQELAAQGDCIIVGRGANALLQDYSPFNIFVYADMNCKVERCRSYEPKSEHLSYREIQREIQRIDAARAREYQLVSDFKWGDKQGYHLCINTSGLCIKQFIPMLAEYAKQWFK